MARLIFAGSEKNTALRFGEFWYSETLETNQLSKKYGKHSNVKWRGGGHFPLIFKNNNFMY